MLISACRHISSTVGWTLDRISYGHLIRFWLFFPTHPDDLEHFQNIGIIIKYIYEYLDFFANRIFILCFLHNRPWHGPTGLTASGGKIYPSFIITTCAAHFNNKKQQSWGFSSILNSVCTSSGQWLIFLLRLWYV